MHVTTSGPRGPCRGAGAEPQHGGRAATRVSRDLARESECVRKESSVGRVFIFLKPGTASPSDLACTQGPRNVPLLGLRAFDSVMDSVPRNVDPLALRGHART